MAKNEVYRVGEYVPAPVPSTLTGTPLAQAQARGLSSTPAGTPMRVGILNLVTVSEKSDIERQFGNKAGEASVDLAAAHLVPVTIVGATLTWGQAIYIVTATGLLSTDATGAVLWGAALEYGITVGAQKLVAVKIIN